MFGSGSSIALFSRAKTKCNADVRFKTTGMTSDYVLQKGRKTRLPLSVELTMGPAQPVNAAVPEACVRLQITVATAGAVDTNKAISRLQPIQPQEYNQNKESRTKKRRLETEESIALQSLGVSHSTVVRCVMKFRQLYKHNKFPMQESTQQTCFQLALGDAGGSPWARYLGSLLSMQWVPTLPGQLLCVPCANPEWLEDLGLSPIFGSRSGSPAFFCHS
jgi:hypothetical protein